MHPTETPPPATWYETPQGNFVLAREQYLLRKMLSPWPRRGHNLLEIGCGAGHFLELYWEAGFDVTGFDQDPALLHAARTRLADRVDLQSGSPDALPFDDNTFDYVALAPLPQVGPLPHDVIHEAVRVATRGIILRYWPAWSLIRLLRFLPCLSLPPFIQSTANLSWRDCHNLLRQLAPQCALTTRSSLWGPPWTWKEKPWHTRLNDTTLPLPIGGICIIRVDFARSQPLTGIPLRLKNMGMDNVRNFAAPAASSLCDTDTAASSFSDMHTKCICLSTKEKSAP